VNVRAPLLAAGLLLSFHGAVSAEPLADALQAEPAAVQLSSFAQAKQLLLSRQPGLQLQAAAVTRAQGQVEQALAQVLPRLELGLAADYAFLRRPIGNRETRVLDGRTFVPSGTASLSLTFSLSRLAQLDSA
jgi:outer membrane protein TolC